jgi:hypothetical protein
MSADMEWEANEADLAVTDLSEADLHGGAIARGIQIVYRS